MKIILPLPPNMANSRMHWRVKNKARQEYMALCDVWSTRVEDGRVFFSGPSPPHHACGYVVQVAISAVIHHTHTMDQDNSMARLKWPVDWLVRNGYMVNDDPDHLVWTGLPTQVKCKKDNRRVEFLLEPA